MNNKKRLWIAIFLLPSLILFVAIYMVPLCTVIATSFCDWNGFGAVKFTGLNNYREMFIEDKTFGTAIVNTLKWGFFAAFVHVPFGVVVALILSKKPIGWKFVRSSYMLYNVISRAALAVVFIFVFNPGVGLLNGFIRLFGFSDFSINWFFDPKTAFFSVTLTWLFFAGVITLITMAELMSIPQSIYESATIDGATDLQIDLYINLPLLKRIIGTGVIIAATAVFKEFDILFMTTAGGPGDATTNIALMIYNNVFNSYRYGYANALGTMLLLLGVSVMLVCSKLFKMSENSY